MIPSGTRFIGIAESVNLTEKKSAGLNAETQPYTIEDIKGYKVFTALLTQSGGSSDEYLLSGTLTIGVTYNIVVINGDDDFTNVGAPNNNYGTVFIATGTTPTKWTNESELDFNTGAPVATVLENTIGNIWFVYNGEGNYAIISDGLFIDNKTTQFLNSSAFPDEGFIYIGNAPKTINNIYISTINSGYSGSDGYLFNTPIEIRVYS